MSADLEAAVAGLVKARAKCNAAYKRRNDAEADYQQSQESVRQAESAFSEADGQVHHGRHGVAGMTHDLLTFGMAFGLVLLAMHLEGLRRDR